MRSTTADRVLEMLSAVTARHGLSAHARSGNGSEFIAKEMQEWREKANRTTLSIEPGAPWQNGCAKSFNRGLRDEFLEMNYFYALWIWRARWRPFHHCLPWKMLSCRRTRFRQMRVRGVALCLHLCLHLIPAQHVPP